MGMIRAAALGLATAVSLSVAFVAPAMAATSTANAPSASASVHPNSPIPLCGDHFQLTRHGSVVRIVGVDLKAFSSGYMLVFTAYNGKSAGPYGASPNGGANFEINTGSASKTDITVDLTNDANTVTLCSSTYYA